jgi:dTDP-4-amino-4,6-dideoxygalactose transaminase
MRQITFADVRPNYDAIGVLGDVIYDGQFIGGYKVDEFQEAWAEYCGTRYCIGVGNGFDAIHMILRAYGIGAGDDVIVPSNTCLPVWMAVLHTGANVIPVEPEVDTFNIDYRSVRRAYTPNIRAIVAVHMYGQVVLDTVGMYKALSGTPIKVIEDASHAHGAIWGATAKAGSLGHAAAFSFYPTKNLGALGDAGAITTDDIGLADTLVDMRNYGNNRMLGVNSRLDTLQAAFLLERLNTLDEENSIRRTFAQKYLQALVDLDYVQLPHVPVMVDSVWHQFVIKCKTNSDRDNLREYLASHGVQTMVHYPMPPADILKVGYDTPVARHLSQTIISLPIGVHLMDEDIDYVCDVIRQYGDK